jgi:hypothetical protein
VVLPPGRARLATKPLPTGSIMPANTIGRVRGHDAICYLLHRVMKRELG